MTPEMLGPSNVFYIFAGIAILATLFVAIYMKETMGLSDKEKKELYQDKTNVSVLEDNPKTIK